MATVELNQVRKSYGDVDILEGIDLEVDDREFCVFVGPSGCGQSSRLRTIAGPQETTPAAPRTARERPVPPAPRDRGPGGDHPRRAPDGRGEGQRRAAFEARAGDGLPELRP